MKITDKMRLDFLTKHKESLQEYDHCDSSQMYLRTEWAVTGYADGFRTPRQAIDAAIREEKKRRKPRRSRV